MCSGLKIPFFELVLRQNDKGVFMKLDPILKRIAQFLRNWFIDMSILEVDVLF